MNVFSLSLLSLSVVISPLIFAQQETEIEVYEVTGSKLNSSLFTAHSKLSRVEIEAINPVSTIQLLRNIPGVSVSENSKGAGQSFVSIRGGESNFTLIMIDGVIVNDPTNSRGGGFDFNQLDPSAIERVEVYRGGVSAIYGSDAISGVIQFFTRKETDTAIQLMAGNDEYLSANIIASQSFSDQISGLINASTSKQHYSSFENFQSNQLLMKLNAYYSQFQHDVFLSYSDRKTDSFAEDSGGNLYANPYEAEHRDNTLWIGGLQTTYSPENINYLTRIQAKISWSDHTEDAKNPGIYDGELSGVPASDIESDYEKTVAEINSYWQLNEQWQLLVGTANQHATGKNTGTLDYGFPLPVDFKLTQDNVSLFTEINGTVSIVELNLGLRYENPSGFESDTAMRIGISNQVNELTAIYASYSQGYKLPSFFALAHPLIGNPDLKPEESDNIEVGIKSTVFSNVDIELNYFHNDYENLVDFDAEMFTSVNRSSVTAKGVEWQLSSQIQEWLFFQFDVTYLDANVNNEDTELRRRSKWQGGALVDASWDKFSVTLSVDSQSEFYDSSIPTGNYWLGGYTNVSLAGKWQVNNQLDLLANIDNLLDKTYQESIGFTSAGFGYRLGLKYTFN